MTSAARRVPGAGGERSWRDHIPFGLFDRLPLPAHGPPFRAALFTFAPKRLEAIYMCGRYNFSTEGSEALESIALELDGKYGSAAWRRGDITPGANAPILTSGGAELFRWGYPAGRSLVINARAETALEKRLFRGDILLRRCVIPSSGYYEWDPDRKKHLFTLPGRRELYMAGIYSAFGGETRFCILTTAANGSAAKVHPRMPLVLTESGADSWLGGEDCRRILTAAPPRLESVCLDAQLSLW